MARCNNRLVEFRLHIHVHYFIWDVLKLNCPILLLLGNSTTIRNNLKPSIPMPVTRSPRAKYLLAVCCLLYSTTWLLELTHQWKLGHYGFMSQGKHETVSEMGQWQTKLDRSYGPCWSGEQYSILFGICRCTGILILLSLWFFIVLVHVRRSQCKYMYVEVHTGTL